MKHITKLLLFSFCFIFSSLLKAQETGTLKGVITDSKTGEILFGATVVMESEKGKGSAADIDGKYSFSLPAGKHNVIISFAGYSSKIKSVTITAGETTRLNADLATAFKELGAVVVSAGKYEQKVEDLTVSVEIINASLVENKGCTNVEAAINQAPGVQILNSEVQIRGGSGYSFGAGSRVMVMIDGLPLLSGDAGRPSWGFMPTENLEQIEIIKGASSVLYGSSALSGIVNIRTAYPKDTAQTKIVTLFGMYDSPKNKEAQWWEGSNPMLSNTNFFHSQKIGNFDLVFGGNLFMTDGFKGPARTDSAYLTNPDPALAVYPKSGTFSNLRNEEGGFEKRVRANMNLRYRSKKIVGLSYGINFNILKSASIGALLWENGTTGVYRPLPGVATRTDAFIYNIDPFVSLFRPNGNKHTLRTRIFRVNNANTNEQANESTLYYGEYQFQTKIKSLNDVILTSGVMGTHSSGRSELYAANESGTGYNFYSNAAVFAQMDKKFWKKLNVTVGGRYEYFKVNNINQQAVPVFRGGLSFPVAKATFIRSSIGQGFRFPSIAERYILTNAGGIKVYPNPDIQAEKSWNAEVGIKQGLKIGKFYGYLDVAAFWQEYKNTIEFTFSQWGTTGPAFDRFGFKSINVGDTRVIGVDLSVLGQGKFSDHFGVNVIGGYTYTLPQILDADKNFDVTSPDPNNPITLNYKATSVDTTNNILKYRFQHMVKMDVEFSIYDFSFGISYRFTSFMQNVDKIFYVLDASGPSLKGIGLIEARGDIRNPNGTWTIPDTKKPGTSIFDFRLSYKISKKARIAFIVNNVFNLEYALRPLSANEMRQYNLQYALTF